MAGRRTVEKLDLSKYYPSVTSKERSKERLRELRAEYTRLRDIARKRITRLERSEFANDFSASVYKHGFKKLRDMRGDEFSRELYRLAKFVNSPTSTIGGRRRTRDKVISTLRAHGYKNINEGNLRDFGEFMQVVRSRIAGSKYDSERAAAWYDEVYAMEDDDEVGENLWEEFEEWYEKETEERRRISRLLAELGMD